MIPYIYVKICLLDVLFSTNTLGTLSQMTFELPTVRPYSFFRLGRNGMLFL